MKNSKSGKELTPRSSVRKFLKRTPVSEKVRKRLVFGEVLKTQLATSKQKLKGNKEKQVYARLVGNQVLRKYRLLGKSKHFISLKMRKYGCDDLTRPHLSLVYL